jgi:hypothetical protein
MLGCSRVNESVKIVFMAKKRKNRLTPFQIDQHKSVLRKMINSSRFDAAYALARRLMREHPEVIDFAYYEAVLTAEDDTGYSAVEIRARYRSATRKLKSLLRRLAAASSGMRRSIRNEYYWFSRQPYKQYRLGLEYARQGDRESYYSQGVGAAQIARLHGANGRRDLMLKWARRSESAWLRFFELDASWSNSYLFYGVVLGLQGRTREMERAFGRCARIAQRPKGWPVIRDHRRSVEMTLRGCDRDHTV